MKIIYNSKESFEKVKSFLEKNQYLFSWMKNKNGWLITIK